MGIDTDDVLSILRCVDGFVLVVKQQDPNIISTHCFRRREVLVGKTLGIDMKFVLDRVVGIVNSAKPRPLKTRVL
jgi:hypothetical protein